MSSNKCPICGEPTRVYMGNVRKDGLCAKHADMLKSGTIVKCENCNSYFEKAKGCACKKATETKESDKRVIGKNACIVCGYETNEKLFCIKCYHKYKNKALLFKITNCTEIDLVDEYYEGRYVCLDGHVVKSEAERNIDDYLFRHNISHAYEAALAIDGDSKHDIHPDFYLPDFAGNGQKLYIEHWGFNEKDNPDYYKTKKYKIAQYQKLIREDNAITLICTNRNDMIDPESSLNRKLKYYKPNEINWDE